MTTRLPAHLIDLAIIADSTPARYRPERTAVIAAAMLDRIRKDEPGVCRARLNALERERRIAARPRQEV